MGTEHARRDTPQRKLIRRILADCRDHPTAETVYERARAIRPRIGFGTVYRNLSVLADDGEILRLSVPGGPDRFDGTVADHGHYFCNRCGTFGDLTPIDGYYRPVPEGFRVDALVLIVSGRCADCLAVEG